MASTPTLYSLKLQCCLCTKSIISSLLKHEKEMQGLEKLFHSTKSPGALSGFFQKYLLTHYKDSVPVSVLFRHYRPSYTNK